MGRPPARRPARHGRRHPARHARTVAARRRPASRRSGSRRRLPTTWPSSCMGGRGGSCSGVLWLHLDAERHALTAVVVAPRVSGFSPTDGYAPVAAIAGSAGPSAAAAALGGALGVSMDAWIALDRKALDLAVEPMFPMSEVRAARTRYREARAAWRGRGGDRARLGDAVREPARRPPAGRVRGARRGRLLELRARVRVRAQRPDASRARRRWPRRSRRSTATWSRSAPRRSSSSAVAAGRCGTRTRAAWSRCTSPWCWGCAPPGDRAAGHASARGPRASSSIAPAVASRAPPATRPRSRRRLAVSAGAPVEVTLVSGADDRLAFRAARELDRRPALAALVAPARPGDSRRRRRHQGLRDAAQAPSGGGRLRARCSPRRASPRDRRREGAGGGGRRRPAAGLLAAGRRDGATRRRRAPSARGGRARQRPDARAGVLAGDARAGAQLDPPRLRVRRRAPHGRRRRERVGHGRRRAPAAAAPVGLHGGAPAGRRRRLGAGGTGRGHRLPAGVAGGRRWPSPAIWGCRQEVSPRLATCRARSGRDDRSTEHAERRRRPTRKGWSAVGANACRGPVRPDCDAAARRRR